MNRTVVIGGVVAVAVLLGVAAWLLIGGKSTKSTSEQLAAPNAGPIALNPVDVVTDHGASESPDGRTLSITFPKFELTAKSGDTASAVFSTTWRLKLAPDERALVSVASIAGYMKSTAVSAPAPAPAAQPEPTPAAAPAAAPATDGSTPPAEQPAKPPVAGPSPAKPVAGDGVARIIVTFGNDTSVTEWTDATGAGSDRKVAKATALVGGADLRDGSTVPITVTVELSGGTASESLAKVNALDLRLFAETAPVAQPATETPSAPAATDGTPTAPAPAEPGPTTPAPADSGTTTTPNP